MDSVNPSRSPLRPSIHSSQSIRRYNVTADMTPEDYYQLVYNYYLPPDSSYSYVPTGGKHQPQTRSKLSQVVNADDLCSPTTPPPAPSRKKSDAKSSGHRPRPRRTPTSDANRNPAAIALVDRVDNCSEVYEQQLKRESYGGVGQVARKEGNIYGLVMAALQQSGAVYVKQSNDSDAGIPSVKRSTNRSYSNENDEVYRFNDRNPTLPRSNRVQKRSMHHLDAETPPAFNRRSSYNDASGIATHRATRPGLSRSHSTGAAPQAHPGKFYEELDSDVASTRPRARSRGYSVESFSSVVSNAPDPVQQKPHVDGDVYTCMGYMTQDPGSTPVGTSEPPPNPLYNIYRCNGVQVNYFDADTHGPHCPLNRSAKPIRGILKRAPSARFQAKPEDMEELVVTRKRSVMSDPYAYDLVFGEGAGGKEKKSKEGRKEKERERKSRKERKEKERKEKERKEQSGWMKELRSSWLV